MDDIKQENNSDYKNADLFHEKSIKLEEREIRDAAEKACEADKAPLNCIKMTEK